MTLKSGGVNFIGEGYLSDGPPQFNVVAVLFILTFFYFFLFLFRLSLIVVDLVVWKDNNLDLTLVAGWAFLSLIFLRFRFLRSRFSSDRGFERLLHRSVLHSWVWVGIVGRHRWWIHHRVTGVAWGRHLIRRESHGVCIHRYLHVFVIWKTVGIRIGGGWVVKEKRIHSRWKWRFLIRHKQFYIIFKIIRPDTIWGCSIQT